MFRKCHVAMFVGALLAASVLSAQTDASLSGTVADPSGAHIAGASVTALNVDTGVSSPSTTNGDGIYSFPSLPTGTYRLSAEHAGFSKKIIDQVILAVGSQLTVNIDLALGQVSDTVEVAATVTDINASSATIGAGFWIRPNLRISMISPPVRRLARSVRRISSRKPRASGW